MTKIVINNCYGGFGLSEAAMKNFPDYKSAYDIPRNDPLLVEIVEAEPERASGFCASLKVVEIPNDVEWTIEEYDGIEWVAEKHRTWSW